MIVRGGRRRSQGRINEAAEEVTHRNSGKTMGAGLRHVEKQEKKT